MADAAPVAERVGPSAHVSLRPAHSSCVAVWCGLGGKASRDRLSSSRTRAACAEAHAPASFSCPGCKPASRQPSRPPPACPPNFDATPPRLRRRKKESMASRAEMKMCVLLPLRSA
jgi:hypothetical protein